MEGRIQYMIELFDQVYSDRATRHTKIKNASIEALCQTAGGPYQRVIKWLEMRVNEKRNSQESKAQRDELENRFIHEMRKCLDLMKGRREKYGDSWKTLTIESMANLAEMKLHRIARLGAKEAKTRDELQDTINYCTFALIKLNEQDV